MTGLQESLLPARMRRIFYALCIVSAVYFTFTQDFSIGGMYLGIALLFDPFDPKQPFPERPFFQKVVLVAHAIGALSALVLDLFF